MNSIVTSAPGKIMLCGEYAVLFDAPAIVAAVDRRARARVTTGKDDTSQLTTVGHAPGCWRFRRSAGGALHWLDKPPRPHSFALVEQILAVAMPATDRPIELELDTAAFVAADGLRKLGLGSSAALTVALTAALIGPQDDLGRYAHEAHCRFQGGEGSGADVASAIHGGVLVYRRSSPANSRPLSWPAGLQVAILWSGRPASTVERIRDLGKRLSAHGRHATLEALQHQSATVARCWERGDARKTFRRLQAYTGALQAFDETHQLGIFAAGHAVLNDLARGHDVVYKPCGAGGGDIGAAFALNAEALQGFVAAAAQAGFEPLHAVPGAGGVRHEQRAVL